LFEWLKRLFSKPTPVADTQPAPVSNIEKMSIKPCKSCGKSISFKGDCAGRSTAAYVQELAGFFCCTVRKVFFGGPVLNKGLELEDIPVECSILLDTAQRIEVQVQVDSAPEGFFIASRKILFPAGVLSGSGKFLHTHDRYPMRIDIERAGASCGMEFIKVAVQFLFDPLDTGLDQSDEIKVCIQQFSKVSWRRFQ